MRVLMSGEAPVSYAQIHVQSWPGMPKESEYFGGQRNGLCGAAVPGCLSLVTGLNSGRVGFRAELHDEAPPLDETWEDIVEVSFRPTGAVSLVAWGGYGSWPLDLDAIGYRVRYSGSRMDEAHRLGIPEGEEFEPDRYLLQFWPGPPEPDRVVKQTSATAAYWHAAARERPAPPSPEEKAEAERLARRQREQAAAQARLRAEAREWGGRLPSERLRQLRGHALSVAKLDRPLADALAEADPATQRQIARWVVRRAFAEAQLTEVEWIAPALAAMDRGEALPAPFDDDRRAWDLLLTDERVPHTLATSPDGQHDNCLQQAMAFPAVFSAREPDPLSAAFRALWSAAVAFGYGRHGVLFAEVRQAFPALAEGGG
ncbi:hypothetical protein G3I59_07055 [Amycolatopsis rubida]|uniref:Uncharacterized protein n=1 Tax=Amycolatopsis rubida TaxID=112413 RepID=A0ABX0BR97_9PSEU|nr:MULTISPECIES: hypothetical protein [Amycolatopsis]MYW90386.1 hypothetical protein [Amycolatopsis rubida]NEC55363.1 hypothetical protein [Amycolatopsis rubida]OAP21880.1 hypothetical protein A4R44_07338 [Amycolatopsis sp. M39]